MRMSLWVPDVRIYPEYRIYLESRIEGLLVSPVITGPCQRIRASYILHVEDIFRYICRSSSCGTVEMTRRYAQVTPGGLWSYEAIIQHKGRLNIGLHG